jgi:hypothetical protein
MNQRRIRLSRSIKTRLTALVLGVLLAHLRTTIAACMHDSAGPIRPSM